MRATYRASVRVNLELTIRPATAADIENLAWYGSQSWRLDGLRRISARQERGEVTFLVAATPAPEPDGFPVGQLAIDQRTERDRGVVVLWSLAVIPHLQGLGIGRRLMTDAEDVARTGGFTAAELAVNKANDRALGLYDHLGYQICGERVEGFWRPDESGTAEIWEQEDCWLMVKPLA
jgi:ribosomal protein S18 acetylase RimI-like enzyme